jgi:hypothetical protein
MEATSNDTEEPKSDELHDHTTHTNDPAPIKLIFEVRVHGISPREHQRADELHQQRYNIEADEDGRQPTGRCPEESEATILRGDDEKHDSAEDDVDDAGHEDGRKHDHGEGCRVQRAGRRVVGGEDSGSVSAYLAYQEESVDGITEARDESFPPMAMSITIHIQALVLNDWYMASRPLVAKRAQNTAAAASDTEYVYMEYSGPSLRGCSRVGMSAAIMSAKGRVSSRDRRVNDATAGKMKLSRGVIRINNYSPTSRLMANAVPYILRYLRT